MAVFDKNIKPSHRVEILNISFPDFCQLFPSFSLRIPADDQG
jgi:hypothetical protein